LCVAVHQSHDCFRRFLVGGRPGLIAWERVWAHGEILGKAAKVGLGRQRGRCSGLSRRMSEVACYGREEDEVVDGSRRH
jgi:hypothetical protein